MFFICPCFAGGMGGENEQLSSSFSLLSLSLFSFFIPALYFHFLILFSLCILEMLDYITRVVLPQVRVPFFLDFQDNPSSPATELQLELQSKFIQVE